LFQHIPHSFREIRENVGKIMDWLDSDAARNLPDNSCLSQIYWKKCPSSWNVLPFVPAGTTWAPQNNPLPSPSTDESISRSMSNSTLGDIETDDMAKNMEIARKAVFKAIQQTEFRLRNPITV
jgi:hypothetical protein